MRIGALWLRVNVDSSQPVRVCSKGTAFALPVSGQWQSCVSHLDTGWTPCGDVLRKSSTGMWLSSFVVALPEDVGQSLRIRQAIEAVECFDTGEIVDRRLPVVMEVPDACTARDWFQWVERLPGVVKVDVAFISFDAADNPPPPSREIEVLS